MRLLNSIALQLEDFASNEIPPHAIFSYNWDRGEVLFTDLGTNRAKSKEQRAKRSTRRSSVHVASLYRTGFSMPGLTPALVIEVAVLNYPRQSIQCIRSMRGQRCVTHICQTSQKSQPLIMLALSFLEAGGSLEVGLYKSSLRLKLSYSSALTVLKSEKSRLPSPPSCPPSRVLTRKS